MFMRDVLAEAFIVKIMGRKAFSCGKDVEEGDLETHEVVWGLSYRIT